MSQRDEDLAVLKWEMTGVKAELDALRRHAKKGESTNGDA